MASNSILKLQVDDRQYEASLKSAQQGLQALMNALRNSGKSFSDLDKNTAQYVRALGNMEATAKTTRGRIGEMSSAFVELSQVEKQLTDQERQSPVGKALTESLGQLKQRTIEAKQELEDLDKQLTSQKAPATTGGLFSGIGSKMEGALAVFGGNLMTKAAGAVAQLGSEMADMVKQGVEMAKAGEGIRIAFERLGRGDILQGLREATHGTVTDLELMKAAVKFNDFKLPVEELGTMLAFAQQKAKDTGQSVDYMVDSIVTGLGRKSLMILDNLGLSATEVRERMKETGDMTKAVGAIIREQMAKAGDYVETAADRAAQANVSLQNKMEELGRKFAPIEEASNQLWTSMKIGILDIVGGPLAQLLNGLTEAGRMRNALVNNQLGKLRVAKAAGSGYMTRSLYGGQVEQYNRQINAADTYLKQYDSNHSAVNTVLMAASKQFGQKFDSISDLKAFKDAYVSMKNEYVKGAQEIMNATSGAKGTTTTTTTTTMGGGGGGKGGNTPSITEIIPKGSVKDLTQQMQELKKAQQLVTNSEDWKNYETQIGVILKKINLLTGKIGMVLPDDDLQNNISSLAKGTGNGIIANPFADDSKKTDGLKLTLDNKAMKSVTQGIEKSLPKVLTKEQKIEGMQNLLGGVNGMLGGIQQIGIEIPEEIQSVMSVLNGIMTVVSSIESIVITGQLLGLFANGGVVHAANGYVSGNNFSGDMVPAMLNSGELVLNRFQQQALAANIQNKGGGEMQVVGKIRGEEIVLVANRYFKRTGQGEILTW